MPALSIRGAVKSTMTPPIPKAQAWAQHFPATSSRPLLNLSQGVPGEAPDKSVLDKLSSLSKERECANYGPIQGEAVLREAVLQEMRDVYKWDHSNGTTERNGSSSSGLKKENIAISSGCNQAFFIVLSALCQEGDDVIIPCPWVSTRRTSFNMVRY
jgi:aspartate/methionine/tyrosine aminotransferase